MDTIFSKILSMSLSASFVIVAVLLLRILLKKAPRKYSYFLWLLVFFRLLCPFSIESAFSLIPVKEDAISYQNSVSGSSVKIDTGIDSMDWAVNQGISAGSQAAFNEALQGKEMSFMEIFFSVMIFVWITGVAALAVCGCMQVIRLKYRLRTAVLVKDYHLYKGNVVRNKDSFGRQKKGCLIYESEYIDTAFLFGFFRPSIYLPVGIEEERGYVIAHELMHKKRLDYIVKPICYLAVILHWFNPLVWLSFHLMIKDMEMSCDEQVLKSAIEDIRGDYSKSLLNLSVKGSGFRMPLAFGESNTRERIRHVLKYKKPSTWIGIGAIVVLLVAAITLLPDMYSGEEQDSSKEGDISWEEMNTSEGEKQLEELFKQLSENRNPYIGDNSADGKLIGFLPGLSCYEYGGMSLQTQEQPYELTIVYEKTEPVSVREEQENVDTMIRNAIFLFATIENMDICSFALVEDSEEFFTSGDNSEEIEGTTEATPQIQTMSYTREEMEKLFGQLYPKSETPEGLMQLQEDYEDYVAKMERATSSTVEPILSDPIWGGTIWEDTGIANSNGIEAETQEETENLQVRIDNFISQAILDYMKKQDAEERDFVEAHVILGGEEAVFKELAESDTEMEFYLLVKSAVYGNIVESVGGCFPAKVTISIAEDGSYELKNFWMPRDESLLEEDVKAVFPEGLWEAAISMKGYKEQLAEELKKKGIKQMN